MTLKEDRSKSPPNCESLHRFVHLPDQESEISRDLKDDKDGDKVTASLCMLSDEDEKREK